MILQQKTTRSNKNHVIVAFVDFCIQWFLETTTNLNDTQTLKA